MNYLYDFLIVLLALQVSKYISGFMFSIFKADKYEDVLAEKIATEVVKELNKKR